MSFLSKVIKRQGGFGLFEVLLALLFLSLISLGVTRSMVVTFKTTKQVDRNGVATQLVKEAMEEFVGVDPEQLDDGDDVTETILENGIEYLKVVDVTVNANRSRTIQVTIEGADADLGGKAAMTSSVALWGLR